jgi:hypothetical protein
MAETIAVYEHAELDKVKRQFRIAEIRAERVDQAVHLRRIDLDPAGRTVGFALIP